MTGLIVIVISFIVASIIRVFLRAKNECMMAGFIPQLIMIVGGLVGTYLFLQDNWSGLFG